jgi:cation transport regulator ChaC
MRDKVSEVKDYLDIREINGYTIHHTSFYPADGSPSIRTLVYIGTPDNDQFVGPQDPQALAEHIARSRGPSGPNTDYLLSLESALDELSRDSGDDHVTDLANRVRILDTGDEASRRSRLVTSHRDILRGEGDFKHDMSVEEQEETEKPMPST